QIPRLGAVALRPLPILLQWVGEAVGIFQALDGAARAGIAVPEPGGADPRAGLVGAHPEAEATQPMDGIEAGQAAADDGDIKSPLTGSALTGRKRRRTVGSVRHGDSDRVLLCD